MTVTVPLKAHEATRVQTFTGIEQWPMHNNRTPDSMEYEAIGSEGVKPRHHTNHTHTTTAMLLGNATMPTVGGKNVTLEQQYMRRADKTLQLGTPEIPEKANKVIMRESIDSINYKKLGKARDAFGALQEENIPSTSRGARRDKDTERSRYIASQTTKSAG